MKIYLNEKEDKIEIPISAIEKIYEKFADSTSLDPDAENDGREFLDKAFGIRLKRDFLYIYL